MSFLTDVEAELGKAEDALKAKFAELTGVALDAAKVDEEKLKVEITQAVADAKAAALAAVQADAPQAAPEVAKAVEALEAAVVAALEKHLVP